MAQVHFGEEYTVLGIDMAEIGTADFVLQSPVIRSPLLKAPRPVIAKANEAYKRWAKAARRAESAPAPVTLWWLASWKKWLREEGFAR